jgi:hypothetical protein
MDNSMAKFDQDNDGTLTQKEFELYQQNEKLQATLAKQDAQRKMAWVSMAAIIVVTGALFLPGVSEARIDALVPMLDWFYISTASIVGAFMGMTAWMSKK